ncbi:MAG: thymidine phosphorylase [Clostridia bacterium]|nr:thymidine phosphorylase [Clostridia bacterium]
MRIYDIIDKKRHSLPLTKEEIEFAINGYMNEDIADYQMSALLMAICINGMNDEETLNLTDAMLKSGKALDLSCFDNLSVDKHSTGGVGDKTTLIVAPIVASLGLKVAKMSGRGLGFTGGTIDKLESLGKFSTSLSQSKFLNQVDRIGVCVIGQSDSLVPADKKLYALRDVTATVESIPLIASSIMSKKLASGAKSIVLDIKIGNGAFMKDLESGIALANAMIKIGNGFGRNVRCVLTNMNVPLGFAVGNSLEVYEAIQALSGKGEKRLLEIARALSSNMVSMGLGIDNEKAYQMVDEAISSGRALIKLKEWVIAQGGDVKYINNPELLLRAKHKEEYVAKESGYISSISARGVGIASMLLGAGRVKKTDKIDHLAGIVLEKSYGDYVEKGKVIATLYSQDKGLFPGSRSILTNAITYSQAKPDDEKLIFDIIS